MYNNKDSKTNPIKEIENTWIVLSDGTKLAARIWMPVDAEQNPVPAILEYLPYRKRDGTNERDELTYPYFAENGYAGVRVDMRGNGDSDGLMSDEYLAQEQNDALEVIEWLTAQVWCDGNVGMMGISWGGFNGLQVAALKPSALKAVISLCSTDNRYSDDIHYKGGALLMENVGWAATMLSYSSRPPDPLLRDDWEEVWMHRLENTQLLLEKWLSHPTDDTLWQHGSIDRDYSDIKAATLLVGGWHDAYTNTIPRMLENLKCPRQGIVGPWAHKYPHIAVPEPRIGFLQVALRWWDHWLKKIDNGVMDDPLYRAYLMDNVAPQSSYTHRAGHWVAQHKMPDENIKQQRLGLAHFLSASGAKTTITHNSPTDTGTSGGEYCIMWLGPDWPTDQRNDDMRSISYDKKLDQSTTLFGAPKITLALSTDQPGGNIIARLCDVAADGASTLITYGVLNLEHRDSHQKPHPMKLGKVETIEIKLDDCGYSVPKGHALRVTIATAHWPLLWPSKYNPTLTIDFENSFIDLPVYENTKTDEVQFPEAITSKGCDLEILSEPRSYRTVIKDPGDGSTKVEILNDFGKTKNNEHGLIKHETNHEVHSIHKDSHLSAHTVITGMQALQRDKWNVRTDTVTEIISDADNFYIKASVQAYKRETRVFSKEWNKSVRRG